MPSNESLTEKELNEYIRESLINLGARDLISEIDETISKGSVNIEESKTSKAKSFRTMSDGEQLAIALEYILTSFEIPFMLSEAKNTLKCKEMKWDFNFIKQDEIQVKIWGAEITSENMDLHTPVTNLLKVFDEIDLPYPEVV